MAPNAKTISRTVKHVAASSGTLGSGIVVAHKKLIEAPDDEHPSAVYIVIGNILTLTALYLAFKCKNRLGGLDFGQLIVAFLCSPCYILYRLTTPCN